MKYRIFKIAWVLLLAAFGFCGYQLARECPEYAVVVAWVVIGLLLASFVLIYLMDHRQRRVEK